VATAAAYTCQWVARPRVRLSVIGVLLLLIGGLFVTNSVWTLPIVVIGALMVVVAWMGHRLEGRFAVEWGETGAEFAFRATVKAASAPPGVPVDAPALEEAPTPAVERAGHAPRDQIIEGEAHTVEIDVTELKALIAAAEAAEPAGPRGALPASEFRIRRAGNGVRSSQPAG
jgi:hypothetical protein